jgi:hypothetical protein
MITVDEDGLVLSSGKRVDANGAIVGLALLQSDATDNLRVFGGYDDSISWPIPEWWDGEQKVEAEKYFLTNADMKELATYMSQRWAQLADSIG